MSLKRNIAANYVSQFYVVLIGIALVPVYLRLMGAEAYGLVAFFTLLQTWLQLADVGLMSATAREAARYAGGACDAITFRELLRSLEGVLWAFALAAAVILVVAAPTIASDWLNRETLSGAAVETSLLVMAIVVVMRWVSGLYRAVISGLEHQVWLSVFNIVAVTARFAGVIPVLLWFGPGPVQFFVYQAIVSVFELLWLMAYSYSLVPLPRATAIKWSLQPVRSIFRFSATVAFVAMVGILVTQTDKLVLSKLLPLRDYGLFTAAVLVASGITLLSAPISQALLPRLTRVSQQSDGGSVVLLYRQATEAIAAIAGSASIVLAVFARQVLWAWTGDAEFSNSYAPVLAAYAIGNGFLAMAAFPYYLQFAKGDLRLHIWGSVLFVLVLVPTIAAATARFGVNGAGVVWALTNAMFLFLWTPIVHRKFMPGQHGTWLLKDVLKVLVGPLLIGALLLQMPDVNMGRIGWAVFIVSCACGTTIVALLSCDLLRAQLNVMLTRLTPAWRQRQSMQSHPSDAGKRP